MSLPWVHLPGTVSRSSSISSSSKTKRKRPTDQAKSDAAIQTEHVPKRKPVATAGVQTDAVPYTLNGKRVEVSVKKVCKLILVWPQH